MMPCESTKYSVILRHFWLFASQLKFRFVSWGDCGVSVDTSVICAGHIYIEGGLIRLNTIILYNSFVYASVNK